MSRTLVGTLRFVSYSSRRRPSGLLRQYLCLHQRTAPCLKYCSVPVKYLEIIFLRVRTVTTPRCSGWTHVVGFTRTYANLCLCSRRQVDRRHFEGRKIYDNITRVLRLGDAIQPSHGRCTENASIISTTWQAHPPPTNPTCASWRFTPVIKSTLNLPALQQMGNNYADMDEYVRRLDRNRVRLVTKLKVRSRAK